MIKEIGKNEGDMKGKVSLKIKTQKAEKQRETQGSCKKLHRSVRATWP